MLLDDYKLNLSFTLLIQSSSLSNIHHYNYDQKKLYRLIKFLKEERGIVIEELVIYCMIKVLEQ